MGLWTSDKWNGILPVDVIEGEAGTNPYGCWERVVVAGAPYCITWGICKENPGDDGCETCTYVYTGEFPIPVAAVGPE